MFPQPQPDYYHDGFNERLLGAVPSGARRILEVGCARGRLGHELKRQDQRRHVAGVELDPDAARVAGERLDEVFVLDVQAETPPIEPGSLDCIIFGDVLEHLVDPEDVLRRYRHLLAPDGLVLVSVPNIQHFSIVKNLLRGDFMYQPSGLLDSTHLRFFTYMTFAKLMLDAGFLPRIEDRIRSGEAEPLVEAAAPLLTHCRVHPDAALEPLDTFQYVVSGRKLPDTPSRFGSTPITFVACVNDDDQLESNLLRSPCLDPGTPHEVILMRGQTSAADGFNTALEKARHDLVVFVQQDIYLPRGWDSRFLEQLQEAERLFPTIGVAGVFGYSFGPDGKTDLGRVLDRQTLLDMPTPLPAHADGAGRDRPGGAAGHPATVRSQPGLPPLRRRPVPRLPAPGPAHRRARRSLPAQLAVRVSLAGLPQGTRTSPRQVAGGAAALQQHGPAGHDGPAAGAADMGGRAPRERRATRRRAGVRQRPARRPAPTHRQHGGQRLLAPAQPRPPDAPPTMSVADR